MSARRQLIEVDQCNVPTLVGLNYRRPNYAVLFNSDVATEWLATVGSPKNIYVGAIASR